MKFYIFIWLLTIQVNAFQVRNGIDISLFPKIENFHPPEGYQPVKGFEPQNYKPNRKFNEFTIQTKQFNFQTPSFVDYPSYYNPNLPHEQHKNGLSLSQTNRAPHNQIDFGPKLPNIFQLVPTTKETKSFEIENWRRTPPSKLCNLNKETLVWISLLFVYADVFFDVKTNLRIGEKLIDSLICQSYV